MCIFSGLTGNKQRARIFIRKPDEKKATASLSEALRDKEDGMKGLRWVGMVLLGLILTSCGGNPYLDASLDPTEFEGKNQAWFEEKMGKPTAKSARFFGGETWVYSRIAGGKTSFPFFNFSPRMSHQLGF